MSEVLDIAIDIVTIGLAAFWISRVGMCLTDVLNEKAKLLKEQAHSVHIGTLVQARNNAIPTRTEDM